MRARLSSHGLAAGIVAAFVFILWFTGVDVVRGQPLATPAYLTGVLFSFTTVLPATARLFVFLVVLFLAFGGLGILTAHVLRARALRPRLAYGVLVAAHIFALAHFGSLLVFDVNITRALGPLAFVTGCLAAGTVLLAWLRRRDETFDSSA